MYLLDKNVYSGPLPVFNWLVVILLLSCMSSLYIFGISSLSDRWFANIFFPFHGLNLCFSDFFFPVWKFLSLE